MVEAVDPQAAFIAATIGKVHQVLADFWEGADADSAFDGGEWSSSFFSQERAEGAALEILGEYGWEDTLEEYIELAARVLGWKLLLRRYGQLAAYSTAGQHQAYANDERAQRFMSRDFKDLKELSDEIKSMGESIGRFLA